MELPRGDESDLPEPVAAAGFIELEPANYVAPFEPTRELRSERTRLFYSFTPAEEGAKDKPLFVFFNGGPGAASTTLLSFGTAPYTLDPDDLNAPLRPNAYRFTRLGNLLYIDARQAGFSYGQAGQPQVAAERAKENALGSFNAAADGADFVRVLLRVLQKLPAVRNNPVVIVGESYGGTRAAVMLDLLLSTNTTDVPYIEPTLASELDAHFRSVFRGVDPERITRAVRARQFGWQVLIQPLVVGSAQFTETKGSVDATLNRIAESEGIGPEQVKRERCPFDAAQKTSWYDDVEAAIRTTITSPAGFRQLTGVAPELVTGLRSSERLGAFRIQDSATPNPAAWVLQLGDLPAWDGYYNAFVPWPHEGAKTVFQTPVYAIPFVRAARHVETMITNAARDLVVNSESIVPALNALAWAGKEPAFKGAEYLHTEPGSAKRIKLIYGAEQDLGPATERHIYLPSFEHSGHFVTAAQPAEFFAEVSKFLAETGL